MSDQGFFNDAWGRGEHPEPAGLASREAPTELIPRIVGDESRNGGEGPESLEDPDPDEGHEDDFDGGVPSRRGRPSRSGGGRSTGAPPRRHGHLVALSVVGELMITLGAFLALFVVYTLWWTNVVADKQAQQETNVIEQQLHQDQTATPAKPGQTTAPAPTTFKPSQGFGLMTIPAIDKRNIPIMEGTDKATVLDKGAVGHYDDPQTAMPWDPVGNFAVAAHRRTHAEPFRYINKLKPGDHVVVETAKGWFVYQLDKELPQTDPTNLGVIAPIPVGGPFTKPGRYITLTTCTPEWASTYRLIWWGHLERVDPLNGPPPPELNGR